MNTIRLRVIPSGGIGLGGAVFLVFLILRLTGHIDWSWWWVTAPLWAPLVVFAAILAFALMLAGIGALLAPHRGRRRW